MEDVKRRRRSNKSISKDKTGLKPFIINIYNQSTYMKVC